MLKVGHERSTVVLGTRGSKLAVQQSEWVQGQLHALAPHGTVTLQEDPNIETRFLTFRWPKLVGRDCS
jgi:hydroxymethylbilane synthase